ncbi:hypothetical protein V8F20_012059, partial [Naviculisporaceae sp. PSN 640]
FCLDEAFSVPQTELTGVACCLEKAIKLLDQHPNFTESRALIFVDADSAHCRIRYGVEGHPNQSFHSAHTRPIVKAIIWLSYQLRDRGCPVELHWIPRRIVEPARFADDLAGTWRSYPEAWWQPGGGYHTQQLGSLPARLRDEIR